MTKRYIALFGLVLFLGFVSLPPVVAQERNLFVICRNKELLLVKSNMKVAIAQCHQLDWFAAFEVAEISRGKRQKHSIREIEVLRSLAKSATKNLDPKPLDQSELDTISKNAEREQTVRLQFDELPMHLRDFLKGTMRLIITWGAKYGDGRYVEQSRFKITVKSPNPTIKEILEEIRRANPDRESVKLYGKWYYLKDPITEKQLDETKTAADYNLKSGSVLRLFTNIR